MKISKDIIKKYSNDMELGSYVRSVYSNEKIVKENSNNFVLGALVRKLAYEKKKSYEKST